MPAVARTLLWIVTPLLLAGCASMAAERLSGSLTKAMLNQDDPETVRVGAPAYLLLLDGLIQDAPHDQGLLIAGARLYSAYGSGLVSERERSSRLLARAMEYASRALCDPEPAVCEAAKLPYARFTQAVDEVGSSQIEALYTYGTTWAGWVQANSNDWNALANLGKIEYLLQRVADLDPGYDRGRVQLYLGVIRTQLPPALGGKPEDGRLHFEQAIAFSHGRDLLAKVEFARRYARLVFNQKLHDRLLHEVLAANPQEPGLTLSNTLARETARALLNDGYF